MSKLKEYHDQVTADFNKLFDKKDQPYFLTTAIKQANHKTLEDVEELIEKRIKEIQATYDRKVSEAKVFELRVILTNLKTLKL